MFGLSHSAISAYQHLIFHSRRFYSLDYYFFLNKVLIFLFQFGMKPTLSLYPFLLHAFFMSIFASVIGPFGGFFGSGFKRAFKIKDFGDMIPGHGGVMDRFDCQFLMATFVNVYIHSFIRMASPQKLLQQVTVCFTNYKYRISLNKVHGH